jgi:hypothetical protein
MKPTATVFRVLLLASFLAALATTRVDHVFPTLVAPEFRALRDGPPLASDFSRSPLFLGLGLLGLGSGFVSSVGLFFFKSWARPLSIFAVIVGLPVYVLSGQFVTSGWAEAFEQLSLQFGGAVIAMAYWSPLSERFYRAAA